MASDNVQRIVRQCSDEGRSLAIRVNTRFCIEENSAVSNTWLFFCRY